MPGHTRIPLSVRIDQEDADFIAALKIEGAATPSEKIRELLKQARLSHNQAHDYAHVLSNMERFLHTAKHQILYSEKELGVHSAILARLFELLPDLVATAADIAPDIDRHALQQHEHRVMQRIARLSEAVLQLAVAGHGSAYDDAVFKQLDNTLQLAHIIRSRQT
ncbi:MAG: hypothetical protein Q4A62_09110 [Eikenella sp.]|nr:hypothetical protein [Eikenella sp.]